MTFPSTRKLLKLKVITNDKLTSMEKTCMLYINCNEERKFLFKKKGYPILECKKCGHRFIEISDQVNHLSKVYSDDYFFGGKDGYPNYLEEKDLLYKSGLKYAKIISKYANTGKVLDVGCAAGFILKGFEKSGWGCHGIEPNDTMANYGRKELNLNIATGGLETFQTSEKFDLITLIQVIGQFYDLDKALKNVSHLLTQNGLVLVENWNMKSTYAKIMGKHWHEYSPPRVVHWFSDKTLVQLFNFYGFELIKKGYRLKRINLRHALSLFQEITPKFIFKDKMIKSLDRAFGNLTFIYPPLDLKWYIFRKLPRKK